MRKKNLGTPRKLKRNRKKAAVHIFYLIFNIFICSAPAFGESTIGLRSGSTSFQVVGAVSKSIGMSTLGADLQSTIGLHYAAHAFFENQGQQYVNGGLGIRYFPWSTSGNKESMDKIVQLEYDDSLKPYANISFSVGRLRLLADELGANEVGTGISSVDFILGFLISFHSVLVGAEYGIGTSTPTSDTAVSVTSISKSSFHMSVYIYL